MKNADRLASIISESLNEYAGYMARGEMVPRHSPGSPAFWFYGLAREQGALCRSKKFRKLLTGDARAALNAKPSLWGRSSVVRVNGVWKLHRTRVLNQVPPSAGSRPPLSPPGTAPVEHGPTGALAELARSTLRPGSFVPAELFSLRLASVAKP